MTIQMKATEQYFPVVLFIMLCKMLLRVGSADKILQCDHSNESNLTVVQDKVVVRFGSVEEILKCRSSTSLWCYLLSCTRRC